jgi:hypothetical protein
LFYCFTFIIKQPPAASNKLQAIQLSARSLRLAALLSLSLLESGVLFVDHEKSPFAAHNFAVGASFLDGCSYFHKICLGLPALTFTAQASS